MAIKKTKILDGERDTGASAKLSPMVVIEGRYNMKLENGGKNKEKEITTRKLAEECVCGEIIPVSRGGGLIPNSQLF